MTTNVIDAASGKGPFANPRGGERTLVLLLATQEARGIIQTRARGRGHRRRRHLDASRRGQRRGSRRVREARPLTGKRIRRAAIQIFLRTCTPKLTEEVSSEVRPYGARRSW